MLADVSCGVKTGSRGLATGRLLHPLKRTLDGHFRRSVLCHNRTHAPQQEELFDHLVGAGKQRWRNGEAECFRGLEIDSQIEIGALLHRQI